MTPFFRLLSMSIIPIVLYFLESSIQKNNSKELIENITKEHVVMRLPKSYAYIGFLGIMVLVVLMIFICDRDTEKWVFIEFAAFILLGVFLVVSQIFWKIEVFRSEDYFLHRNIPFRTKKIFYSDCRSYKYCKDGNTVKLQMSKRNIYIDIHVSNFEIFLATLYKNGVKEIKK